MKRTHFFVSEGNESVSDKGAQETQKKRISPSAFTKEFHQGFACKSALTQRGSILKGTIHKVSKYAVLQFFTLKGTMHNAL